MAKSANSGSIGQYRAFISYRHQSPDAEIAKKLHTLIENYRVPSRIAKDRGIKRMGRVFRDSEELPLTPDLGKDIEQALDNSEWFIAVCSPRYLESLWCRRELEYYLQHKGREHILAVLVEGEPDDSFPKELVFAPDGTPVAEPLAANARGNSLREQLRRLKSEKLRLLAPMLGVGYDELYRRQSRRRIRNILIISCVSVAALGAFLVYALAQNARIEEQRVTASRNECDLLVEKSLYYTSDNRKREARELALQALEVSEGIDDYNSGSVFDALAKSTYSGDFDAVSPVSIPGDFAEQFVYSPDSSKIAMIGGTEAAVIDAATGQTLWMSAPARQPLKTVRWSPDSAVLVLTSNSGHKVLLLEAETGEILHQLDESWAADAVYDGKTAYVVCEKGILRWDPVSGDTEILTDISRNQSAATAVTGPILVSQADIFTASFKIVDTRDGKVREYTPASAAMAEPFSPSPEGDRLFVHQWNKDYVVNTDTGEVLWENALEDSKDGYTQKAFWLGDYVFCLNRAYNAETGKCLFNYTGNVLGMTEDGRYLVTGDGFYDLQDGTRYAALSGNPCAMDHAGKQLLMRAGNETAFTAVMPGNGSQYISEHYTGTPLHFENWNAPVLNLQLESVNLIDDFAEGNTNGYSAVKSGVTPDHRFYVVLGDGISIKIWDADYGEIVKHRIYGYTDPIPIGDFCFSKDSKRIAIAGGYGKVGVYDLDTGVTLHLWQEQYLKNTLTGIRFNADGTLVMTEAGYTSIYTVYSVTDGLILYRMRADREVTDWGFDQQTGDAVLVYTDGSARVAEIFNGLDELRAYTGEQEK